MHQHDPRRDGPDSGGPLKDLRGSLNVLTFFIQCLGMPWRAWMTRFGSWGENFAGFHMMVGWLLMLCVSLFFPQEEAGPLIAVWIATGVLLAMHRLAGAWKRRNGYRVHSRYVGRSWITFCSEHSAKTHWEPLVGFLVGIAACLASPPVGAWIITAAFCQGFSHAWQEEADLAKARAIRDARAEQEYIADLVEKGGGDE